MKKFGLIGETLVYSFSPQIHKKLGDYEYVICETAEKDLPALLADQSFSGFNVTIPYKKKVFDLCDEVSKDSHRIGSVNAVIRKEDGRLYGYNTDYFGFRYSLRMYHIDPAGRKCLVLGTGGASLTVKAVLEDLGASQIVRISRNGPDNYENLFRHYDAQIIVNTTPVGMYPNNLACLIDLNKFNDLRGVVDLIYNPYRTKLILQAGNLGVPSCGGLDMLVAQAWETSCIFRGIEADYDDGEIENVVEQIREEMLNTVLIGMPGAGKTSLGKLIAARKGHEFLDTDDMVEAEEGMSIPEIFQTKGEDYFREIETRMLARACKQTGKVIATGGGIVTREENRDIMRQNGSVIWIKRDLDKLENTGRPLSQRYRVEKLYRERKDAYESWSDYFIDNNQELH